MLPNCLSNHRQYCSIFNTSLCYICNNRKSLSITVSVWLGLGKYLYNYWMDYCVILERHSWYPEDEAYWLWRSPNFPLAPLTFDVWHIWPLVRSWKLLDELKWGCRLSLNHHQGSTFVNLLHGRERLLLCVAFSSMQSLGFPFEIKMGTMLDSNIQLSTPAYCTSCTHTQYFLMQWGIVINISGVLSIQFYPKMKWFRLSGQTHIDNLLTTLASCCFWLFCSVTMFLDLSCFVKYYDNQ